MLRFTTMKLKDRLILIVISALVLVTIFLVLDLETMLTGSRSLLNSNIKVQPARGRHTFFQRHLQKTTNGSRENGSFGGNKFNSNVNNNIDDGGNDPHVKNSNDRKRQRFNSNKASPDIDYDHPATGAPQPQSRSSSTSSTSTLPPEPFTDLVSLVLKIDQINHMARRNHKHWNPNLGDLLGLELR